KAGKAVAVKVRGSTFNADVNEGEGQLLLSVEQTNKLITERIRAEVENELREARNRMSTDPVGVEQNLKLMMQRVVKVPELKAEVRAQLRGQLETALRQSNRVAATKEILDQQAEEARAAHLDAFRVGSTLQRDQDKLKQLMDRYTSLMDEGRYTV